MKIGLIVYYGCQNIPLAGYLLFSFHQFTLLKMRTELHFESPALDLSTSP